MIEDQLNSILLQLEEASRIYKIELKEMPDGKLLYTHAKDGDRYYLRTYKDDKRIRKSINRNKELIRTLARKEFLESAITKIDTNIDVIRNAKSSYSPCNLDEIAEKLSSKYGALPKAAFFEPKNDSVAFGLDATVAQRIASHKDWAEAQYAPSDYLAEGRKLITSKGERMRSKAEVLIAEKLYEYGIPFRYEQTLEINGSIFHPDFTFEGTGGEMFFLEFCGMMDNAEYVASFLRKRASYEAAGIYEWKNLIYIYSSGNDINMMLIDNAIKNRIIPWL